MKLLLGLLVSLAISSAFATPVRSPKDEVDIVEVPRGQQRSRESTNVGASDDESDVDPDFRNFKGVVDTGAGYPFLAPLPHPFSFNLGFFDSFEDIFRRLRTRLWSMGSGETSEEGTFSLGSAPPKGGNTTSVVKVVDGHKIEINDTVYGNGDGKNGAVFKFRVINIRPLDSGEELADSATEGTTIQTKVRDIEGKSEEKKDSSEELKPDDNEISANIDDPESTTTDMQDIDRLSSALDSNAVDDVKLDDVEVDETEAVETLDEDADTPDEDNVTGDTRRSEQLSMPSDAENYNSDDDNEDAIEDAESQLNKAMKKLSAERENLTSSDDEDEDEDANDVNYDGLNSEWGSLNDRNTMTNEIDVYESVPVDLSNDIAINEMMADQGAPVNPDAEVFDVDEFLANAGSHRAPPQLYEVPKDMK